MATMTERLLAAFEVGVVEVSVRGERGRFRVKGFFPNDTPPSVSVFGGPAGHASWRTFPIERVSRIHRTC